MKGFDEKGSWIDEELRTLPVLDVSASASERTRVECLAVLERRRAMTQARERRTLGWAEPALVTAVSAVYLAAAIQASLAFLL